MSHNTGLKYALESHMGPSLSFRLSLSLSSYILYICVCIYICYDLVGKEKIENPILLSFQQTSGAL